MRKIRLGRLLLRLALACASALAIAALLAWWRLPQVLDFAARRILPKLGLEQAELRVVEASSRGIVIVDAAAAGEGWRASFDRLEASFSLRELWKWRRIESATLSGLSVVADEALIRSLLESETSGDEGEATAQSGADSALEFLPSEGARIEDARIGIQFPDRLVEATWSASLENKGSGALDATLGAALGGARLDIAGELHRDAVSRLTLDATVSDLAGTLDEVLPGWRARFGVPEELRFSLGPVAPSGVVELRPDLSAALDLAIEARAVSASYEEASAEIAAIAATAKVAYPLSGASGRIDVDLRAFAYDDFHLAPQRIALAYASEDLERWKVDCASPIAWDYDLDTASGSASFAAEIDASAPSEAIRFSAKIEVPELFVAEEAIAPFSATARGDLETIRFEAPDLGLRDWPSARIVGGSGEIRLIEEGDWIFVDFRGQVAADALADLQPGLSATELDLEANVAMDDFSETVKLRLKTRAPTRLAALGDASLDGSLALDIDAETDAEAILWNGSAKLAATGLNARGAAWRAAEFGAEATLDFHALDSDLLAADDVPTERLIEHLARAVSGKAEWQGNEIEAGGAIAQWLYGSFELARGSEPDAPLVAATAAASAGVVKLQGETLQQAAFEARARGDLARLETEGRASALFEGQEAALDFRQEARGLLGEHLSLKGEYALAPFVFDYSDALSRNIESLQGLSFTGEISAKGAYWLDEAGPDASVALRLERGAVDYPPQDAAAEGIEARIAMDSLARQVSRPGESSVSVGQIRFGDLTATDAFFAFDALEDQKARAREARLEAFGGRISLEGATVDLAKFEYEGRLIFDELSLSEITTQISFFNGTMEGAISGYLPISYRGGVFRPGEGRLQIPEGQTAKLHYNAEGMFPPPDPAAEAKLPFVDRLGKHVLRALGLEPEPLVEEALGNVTIDRLNVELLPKDAPLTPIRIQLAGSAKAGDIAVPMNIRTNVNGTIDELLDFLIRLNSLGSPSFSE